MKKRILIIEDNEKNRMLEKDLLEIEGFEVLEAKDAAEGIVLAQKERPDGVVMDVRLPDMRGTQAAVKLRQDPGTSGIPIIFVTASVIGEGMEEIKAFPDTMFLTKPIDTRTFAGKIRQYLSKKSCG